jgi:hypothetical protein
LSRYETLIRKLVRERLYDAGCLLTSNSSSKRTVRFEEPAEDLSFIRFAESLLARATAWAKLNG